MNENLKHKILFVDDEEMSRSTFDRNFGDKYQIHFAHNPIKAKEIIASNPDIAIVVADQRMPGETGVDLLELILKQYPKIVRIISTAYSDYNVVVDAINNARVFAYIDKPWNISRLKILLERGIEYYHTSNQEEGLINISSASSNAEVCIEGDELLDIEAILKILSTIGEFDQRKNKSQIKYSLTQKDGDIVIGCQNKQTKVIRHVSLADYRTKAGQITLESDDGSISNILGPTIQPKHLEESSQSDNRRSEPSQYEYKNFRAPSQQDPNAQTIDSRVVQIKKTADEIVFFLVEMRQSFESSGLKSTDALAKLALDLDALISTFRKISENNLFENRNLTKSIEKLSAFMRPFEIGQEPIRLLVTQGIFTESSITGLFVSHNILARLFGKSLLHPSSSMILLARNGNSSENRNALVIFSLLLLSPLLVVLLAPLLKSQISQKFENLIIFSSLVGVALISATAVHKGMGKMKLDQKLSLGPGNSITLASTGAISVFLFVIIFGYKFIFRA